jgi:protein-S-isoprenylcysteine O-methyltransferase Ste14
MSNLVIGGLAFLFFVLYDVNKVTINYRLLRGGFLLGCVLLTGATVGLIYTALNGIDNETQEPIVRTLFFGAIALISLILLIYTLFFAIPFRETYLTSKAQPEVCDTGIYALSRHPGVLWFMGFYLFLWLAIPDPLLLSGGVLFSLLNIFYVLFQDKWVFMKTFPGYSEYKESTPFLFPTYQSCKRCIKTFTS